MSQKAAVVLILDVCYSELLSTGEGKKFIHESRECVSMIIQRKIFINSKDELGLVLMGCKNCNNHDGEIHGNVNIACPLGPPTWHMARKVKCGCTNYDKANWVKAVNVALGLLERTQRKFSEKKIVVFTSNLKLGDLRKLTDFECSIHDQVVDLTLIHPKITDDPAMAELKDDIKEAIALVKKVEGTDCDIEVAALELLSYQKKKVRPQTWNVVLDIGSQISIPVSGYKKLNPSQTVKWSSSLSSSGWSALFPERVDSLPHEESSTTHLPDSSILLSKRKVNARNDGEEVDDTEIIEGFHFGSSIVPFTEDDKRQMEYASGDKCLSVIKITKKKFVPRNFWIENSCTCIVARNDDEDAAVAFSALVRALDFLESVAIVRRLYYSGTKPHYGALFPVIKPNKEYLVFVELPFSNYVRTWNLPELKVNHLTLEQFKVIDQLIDGMDLSVPVDDDGESMVDRQWSDLLTPHKIYDPYLQHVRTCVASRILNPGAPLPSMDPVLYKMLTEPPQPIKESTADTLKEISCIFPNLGPEFDLPRKGREKRNTTTKRADGGDPVTDTVEQPTKKIKIEKNESEIKKENEEPEVVRILHPIEDFNAAVELKAIPVIKVCNQMQEVITKLLVNSYGSADFEKPKDSLKTLRNTVMAYKMDKSHLIDYFNNWMKEFYQMLKDKLKFGFWTLVIQENLGFITSEECSESSLTVTEVNEILGGGETFSQTLADEEEMDLPIDM